MYRTVLLPERCLQWHRHCFRYFLASKRCLRISDTFSPAFKLVTGLGPRDRSPPSPTALSAEARGARRQRDDELLSRDYSTDPDGRASARRKRQRLRELNSSEDREFAFGKLLGMLYSVIRRSRRSTVRISLACDDKNARAGLLLDVSEFEPRPAHILWGWSSSTPRFPTTPWEIVKIIDFSLIFH